MTRNDPLLSAFPAPDETAALRQEMAELGRRLDSLMESHQHNGLQATGVNLDDLVGLFETVSDVPTNVPKSIYDQIKIYVNGVTYRLYCYDGVGQTWRYVALT